jgi:hypothetical protein
MLTSKTQGGRVRPRGGCVRRARERALLPDISSESGPQDRCRGDGVSSSCFFFIIRRKAGEARCERAEVRRAVSGGTFFRHSRPTSRERDRAARAQLGTPHYRGQCHLTVRTTSPHRHGTAVSCCSGSSSSIIAPRKSPTSPSHPAPCCCQARGHFRDEEVRRDTQPSRRRRDAKGPTRVSTSSMLPFMIMEQLPGASGRAQDAGGLPAPLRQSHRQPLPENGCGAII